MRFIRRGLAILGRERGALLWLPALGAACWLVLFAMRVAPNGNALFTRMTSLRVAVVAAAGADADAARTVAALRRGLADRGAMSVVDSARVTSRVDAAARDRAAGAEFAALLRPLNAQLAVVTDVERRGDRVWARLRVFDARAGRWSLETETIAAAPEAAGAALADSLQRAAFAPRPLTAAVR